ncbi:hypothetical protein [Streptomyces bauhiniae]
MDSELAVLVASGATTLVSLMVTDSWTHARELVGRYLTRTGADPGTFDDLQDARNLLLAADATERERTAREIGRRYGARLRRLAEADDGSGEALRALLTRSACSCPARMIRVPWQRELAAPEAAA